MTAPMIYLELTQDEADALMNLLMNAPPTANVPEELAERLLMRVANAQRMASRRVLACDDRGVGENNEALPAAFPAETEVPARAEPTPPLGARAAVRPGVVRVAGGSLSPLAASLLQEA